MPPKGKGKAKVEKIIGGWKVWLDSIEGETFEMKIEPEKLSLNRRIKGLLKNNGKMGMHGCKAPFLMCFAP